MRWSKRTEVAAIALFGTLFAAAVGLAADGMGEPEPSATFATVGLPPYDRDSFGDWRDLDRDCQDTRNEVLIRDLTDVVMDARGCLVLRGVLVDPYTGERVEFVRGITTSRLVQIDHVVPPKAASDAGMPQEVRSAFYNDLDNLVATKGSVNGSKGAQLPSTWLPRVQPSARCDYVVAVLVNSTAWSIDLSDAEDRVIAEAVADCPLALTGG